MNNERSVLIVDDDFDTLELLEIFFGQENYQVTTCSTDEECFRHFEKTRFSAVVLDMRMDDMDGTQICRKIRDSNKTIAIVFFSADATQSSREAGLKAGADAYLMKPTNLDTVVSVVTALIEKQDQNEQIFK